MKKFVVAVAVIFFTMTLAANAFAADLVISKEINIAEDLIETMILKVLKDGSEFYREPNMESFKHTNMLEWIATSSFAKDWMSRNWKNKFVMVATINHHKKIGDISPIFRSMISEGYSADIIKETFDGIEEWVAEYICNLYPDIKREINSLDDIEAILREAARWEAAIED